MFLLAAALSLAITASAAAAPAVIVKVHDARHPGSPYFIVAARPGHPARAGTLELVNPTASPVTVALDPVDALTTSTLGSAYALSSGQLHGPSLWLELSRRRVAIPPHGDRSLEVSVAVPPSASAGDYLAGVSVQAIGQDSVSSSRGLSVGQVERYAIGVETLLPGPRHPQVALTGAVARREPGGLVFEVLARNDGNVILKGVHGWLSVTREGRPVSTVAVTPGTFVSGTAIAYPVRASREQPPQGTRYRVRGELVYPGGVARIDTAVTAGHAVAVTQQRYGGPKLPAPAAPGRIGSLGPAAWLGLLGLLALTFGGFALRRSRFRRPRGPRDAISFLERELARCSARRPLSVARISLAEPTVSRHGLLEAIRPKLRPPDEIFDLGEEGLLVALPDTAAPLAKGIAFELTVRLARCQPPGTVKGTQTATTTEPVDPPELIQRAARAPTPGAP